MVRVYRQIHNFGQNRRSFAEFCLKNKYNYNPDFVQINQGALKMLNFWGQFEPAYWELGPTNANQIVEIDSPQEEILLLHPFL